MTEKQKQWLNNKLKFIQDNIEANWPLSDEQWNIVADTIEKIVNQSKGNQEVRKALHDLVELYDRKARIES